MLTEKDISKINVDTVFAPPQQQGESVAIIPVHSIRCGPHPTPSTPDEMLACLEGNQTDPSASLNVRPIAHIHVGPEGVKVVPVMDRPLIALVGSIFWAWIVTWITLAISAWFAHDDAT